MKNFHVNASRGYFRRSLQNIVLAALVTVGGLSYPALARARPNILVIYFDDMGWGQPGCNGGKLAPTPNLDSMATNGIWFSNGYTTACVCSPSRVGLMTGRYQQRSGHDNLTTSKPGHELLLSETTIAQRLKDVGYSTGLIGKWHLGDREQFLPSSRGFDHYFGTAANLDDGNRQHQFYRDLKPIDPPLESPRTSLLYADASLKFIDTRTPETPFFLYLAFNAVHSPYVASQVWIDKFEHIKNKRKQLYAALVAEVDEAIGKLLVGLRERKIEEDTLIFCISDNGGVIPEAEQGGLRGQKWLLWEGGVRVPFFMVWKGHFPGGRVIDTPVMQIDVLPTALTAAGIPLNPDWQLDGVNLLPLASGSASTIHRPLFWRYGPQFAVRRENWKLVKAGESMKPMLVNLSTDIGETTDLSESNPMIVKELESIWNAWNAKLPPPRWDDPRNRGEEEKKNYLEMIRKKRNPGNGRKPE